MPARKKEECSPHKSIHVRDNNGEGYFDNFPFAVEVSCQPHEMNWICLTKTIEEAMLVIHNFPLVSGGLASRKEARLHHADCILTHIPRNTNV